MEGNGRGGGHKMKLEGWASWKWSYMQCEDFCIFIIDKRGTNSLKFWVVFKGSL